jgi:hypothetical protein
MLSIHPPKSPIVRRALALLTSIAALTLAGGAAAATTKVTLKPRNGHPATKFVARFRNPASTEILAPLTPTETLLVSGPLTAKRCVSSASRLLPAAAVGQPMRVTLDPKRLGGRWCLGRFHGSVTLRQRFSCGPPLEMVCPPISCGPPRYIVCPQLLVAPQTVARFSFRISRAPHRH